MRRIASHAVRFFAAGCFAASAAHATIYCSPSTALAFKGDSVNLYAGSDTGLLTSVTWSTETGHIEAKSSQAVWNFGDATPGRYHAIASVPGTNGSPEPCRVELFYQREPVFRGEK